MFFWWLKRVGARGQEVPFLFWSQLLQRAALLCWLCFSSCQHYLEERVFFFPTQEAYYLDDLRGQSRTSLGAPNFATADAELWVHCAETIPERPFLPQCVHTYMIIVWNLMRFVCFALLLLNKVHALGQKLWVIADAEMTPENAPSFLNTVAYILVGKKGFLD